MKKKNIINFSVTAALAALFIAFTAIVKFVGVEPVGPDGTSVGLASINAAVRDAIGFNRVFYDITECLGILAVFTALCFAAYGAYRLIRFRSLKEVGKDLYALYGLYIALAVLYVLFETVVINCRPVILETKPEASYPSTHTVLAACIFITAAMQVRARMNSRVAGNIAAGVLIALAAVTVIGRLVSGVHWFTDIMGGLLLGATLVMLYYSVVTYNGSLKAIDKE